MIKAVYKTILPVLRESLVPDVVNLILNEIELYYIQKGKEKWNVAVEKMNEEYHNTWYLYENFNGQFLKSYIFSMNVNDRPLHKILSKEHINYIIIWNKGKETKARLPPNY